MYNDYSTNRALDDFLRKEQEKKMKAARENSTNIDMESSFSPKTGNGGIMETRKPPSIEQIKKAQDAQRKLILDTEREQWNALSTGTDEIQIINAQNVAKAKQGLVDLDYELTAAYGLGPKGYWSQNSKTYGLAEQPKAQEANPAHAYALGTGGVSEDAPRVTDESLQMRGKSENSYGIGTGASGKFVPKTNMDNHMYSRGTRGVGFNPEHMYAKGTGGVEGNNKPPEVSETADESGNWFDRIVEDVSDWAEGAVDDVGSAVGGAVDDVVNWTEGAVDDVGNFVEGAAEDTAEWVGGAAEDTAEWVGGAAEDTAEWVGGAAEDTAEWVGGAAEDTAEWVGGAAEYIANLIESRLALSKK